jgi:hypothetical protein
VTFVPETSATNRSDAFFYALAVNDPVLTSWMADTYNGSVWLPVVSRRAALKSLLVDVCTVDFAITELAITDNPAAVTKICLKTGIPVFRYFTLRKFISKNFATGSKFVISVQSVIYVNVRVNCIHNACKVLEPTDVRLGNSDRSISRPYPGNQSALKKGVFGQNTFRSLSSQNQKWIVTKFCHEYRRT